MYHSWGLPPPFNTTGAPHSYRDNPWLAASVYKLARELARTKFHLQTVKRVWMLAKLPDDIRVKHSDDITEKYLLLPNFQRASSPVSVKSAPWHAIQTGRSQPRWHHLKGGSPMIEE